MECIFFGAFIGTAIHELTGDPNRSEEVRGEELLQDIGLSALFCGPQILAALKPVAGKLAVKGCTGGVCKGPGGKKCFVGDTEVTMGDGFFKSIDSIALGDVVSVESSGLIEQEEAISTGRLRRAAPIFWAGAHSGRLQRVSFAPDAVLEHGLSIEVEGGVVTKVLKAGNDRTEYNLVGSRYVRGSVDETDVTASLWRAIDIDLEKPDGTHAEVRLARPLWWLEDVGVRKGRTFDLAVEETGLSGRAMVLNIDAVTGDSRQHRDGEQMVIATIEHQDGEVWDLVFDADASDALGVTATHPIYSEDRGAFVAAGDLAIGEHVRTLRGSVSLTSKSVRSGGADVYNLEVHRAHAYHVSTAAILARNVGLDCSIPKHDAAGGHVQRDHIGKSASDLEKRSLEIGKDTSSWKDLAEAERAKKAVIDANRKYIEQWIANGAKQSDTFVAPFKGGTVWAKGATGTAQGNKASITLRVTAKVTSSS